MNAGEPDGALFPPPLKPGDAVGIAAPASHFDREAFRVGLEALKSMGLVPVLPDAIFERKNYLAGSDVSRADTLNRLMADPAIRGIVCARGGYGSMRVLEHIDYDAVRRHPKTVAGFSDVTALLWALYRRCGLVTCHGPTVTTLGGADEATRASLARVLFGADSIGIAAPDGCVLVPGSAAGLLVGGNLTTLCHLVGTADTPRFDGCVLLLEDRGEAPYRVDRMLTQMRLAGCFEGVVGVALGSFEDCGGTDEVARVALEAFAGMGVPVAAGFDIGHGRTNIAVPLGAPCELDADRGVLRVQGRGA